MRATVLLFFFILISSSNSKASIKDGYGVISYLRGKVEVFQVKIGQWESVKLTSKIFTGSKIRTSVKSMVRVKSNSTTMMIGPSSLVTFNSMGKTKSIVGLVKGFIWSKVDKNKRKSEKLLIKTKGGVSLGVRGTQFAFMQSEKGDLSCVCEGAVELKKKMKSKTLTHGNGISNYGSSNEKNMDYLKMMDNGRPGVEFIKLAKADDRYMRCMYCHNKDFSKDQFILPEYSDLMDFDYD